MRYCLSLLFAAFLLLPATTSAQDAATRISGTVIDASSGESLPGVNVYLSGTTVGVATGSDGSYELTTKLSGSYELVFSFTGYERKVVSLDLTPSGGVDSRKVNAELHPTTVLLDELVVEASNKEWKRNYRLFEEEFIGRTEFAKQTEVVNPWVMEFEEDPETGRLLASNAQPLHLVNRALGYEIYVEIDRFEWRRSGFEGFYRAYPRFVEMEPESEEELRRWRENREDAFIGSRQHFFQSLYDDAVNSEKFYVDPDHFISPLTRGQVRSRLMQRLGTSREMADQFKGYLLAREVAVIHGWVSFYVHSGRAGMIPRNVTTTTVTPPRHNAPFFIDERGNLLDPASLILQGDWAQDRMADTVPLDYDLR